MERFTKSITIDNPKDLEPRVETVGTGKRGYLHPIVSSLREDSDNERVIGIPLSFRGREYPVRFRDNRKNVPVNYRHGLNILPFQELGRWEKIDKTDNNQTKATLWFDLNSEYGKERYRMHVEGVATDWSVEFMADEILEGDDANELYRELGLTENGVRALIGIEYYGVASVPHGAQPDAHDLELKQKFLSDVKGMLIETDAAAFDRIAQLEKEIADLKELITVSRESKEPQRLGDTLLKGFSR